MMRMFDLKIFEIIIQKSPHVNTIPPLIKGLFNSTVMFTIFSDIS